MDLRVKVPVGACIALLVFVPEAALCQPSPKKERAFLDVLRKDDRLKASVSLQFTSRPKAQEVLDRLRRVTGVSLSLDSQMADGPVSFGSMVVHNIPAWKVMEQIAATQLFEGTWEKSGDGYVLRGKPKSFDRPEVAQEKAEGWGGVLTLVLIVIGVGVVLLAMIIVQKLRKGAKGH